MAVQDAHAEATLHDETLRELGLSEQPFVEDKKYQRFADSTTQRTRAALEQHLRFGDSLHLLIGEDGAGKSVLLSQLIKHCKSTIKPFVVKGSEDFQSEAFLAAILHQLDNQSTAESIDEYIENLAPLFEQINDDKYSVVLIVDDAHLAPMEEIAELVDIIQQFETDGGKEARLLLTGRPSLKQEINQFEQQFEELDLQYSTNLLPPMDDNRVREYLASRLHQTGFTNAFPFTDKAIAKIQRDSAALPGRINDNATHYLNGVYRGAGTEAGAGVSKVKTGLLAGLGWPVLLTGAAALGAIGLGLSMFFGSKPDTEIRNVAETVVVEPAIDTAAIETDIEKPIVSTSSVANPTVAVEEPKQEPLVVPTPTESVVAATDTSELNNQLATNIDNSAENINTTVENTVTSLEAEKPLVTEALSTAAATPAPAETTATPGATDVTVPRLPATENTASAKGIGTDTTPESVAVAVTPLDNNLASIANIETDQMGAALDNAALDNAALDNVVVETAREAQNVAVVVDNSTDGAAVAPVTVDNSSTSAGVAVNEPNRAIENERWVLFQSPSKFTVQLATSRERGYIIDLAQTLEAEDPVAIYPFLTTNSQNPVFGLLSGLYDTRAEAITAVDNMDPDTKQFGVWIRPVSDLQDDIKRRK